jgi:hypothetical protein
VIVDNYEMVKIRNKNQKWVEFEAKMDTGAFRSLIDLKYARDLGLLEKDNILWFSDAKDNDKQKRPVVSTELKVKDRIIQTQLRVANREHNRIKVLVGRKDLIGFLVNPQM